MYFKNQFYLENIKANHSERINVTVIYPCMKFASRRTERIIIWKTHVELKSASCDEIKSCKIRLQLWKIRFLVDPTQILNQSFFEQPGVIGNFSTKFTFHRIFSFSFIRWIRGAIYLSNPFEKIVFGFRMSGYLRNRAQDNLCSLLYQIKNLKIKVQCC